MAQFAAPPSLNGPGPRWRRRWSMVQDAMLVVISAAFFFAHATAAVDGQFTSIFFAAEQGLLVGMFLTRRRSIATSTKVTDWVVAAGGWLPLALRPVDSGPLATGIAGVGLQAFGLTLTCIGFVYLGRSFGVVAANRGLKVAGPYRFVRHPIYLSHFITTAGFLVANPGPWNFAVMVPLVVCQLLRIRAEERLLTSTADYTQYRNLVRWRLVPGLY